MSTSPCSVTAEEGYQTCAPASNQPEISITHIYTTNPDASDSSPVELSAAAKALMLQLAIQRQQQQQQQQQAMQEGGSTRILRSSCRQQKRLRHFSFKEVRIPAKKRRQENASYPLNFQDALCYIDKIKLAYLPTKPYVYHSFLEIMLLFRNGCTTTKDVMEMAVALFGNDGVKGRECLLGLSAFCPQGCEIRQGNGEGEWVLLMP